MSDTKKEGKRHPLGNKRVRRDGKKAAMENPLKDPIVAGNGLTSPVDVVGERASKPLKLTASQLTALDHLVGMGGEAYAGNGMFREGSARALGKRKLIEVVKGGASVLFKKYRITEKGRAERARAHEAKRLEKEARRVAR